MRSCHQQSVPPVTGRAYFPFPWSGVGLGVRATASLVFLLLLVSLLGCESAEKYKRSAATDSTSLPQAGTLAVKGTPEEMRVVRNFGHGMDSARVLWDMGEKAAAIATVDSLRVVAEATLDTIPLGHPVANFLLIYVTDAYDRLSAWHKERGDDKDIQTLNLRFESLAERLQKRRDSTTATKTP
jgi:hypothetical protein